ncbi:MAG: carboxymuconolactone decarboxylase family protein [Deltaproteobacteria bacterium]|nr:carboxymuconolactone decarboxylase family protein [Deltaproteobacteria bacterium]
MTDFSIHTHQTAPQGSKPILEGVQKAYGFVPNLMGTLAESPAAVEGYAALSGIFGNSDLTPTEQEVILMTNNRLNNCGYCMAAHTTVARMKRLPDDVIESLRNGLPIADAKLETLRLFAAKVNRQRGVIDPADVDAFLAAGYTRANILEVILGTALKVMSNYSSHVADTPIDGAFQSNIWSEAA